VQTKLIVMASFVAACSSPALSVVNPSDLAVPTLVWDLAEQRPLDSGIADLTASCVASCRVSHPDGAAAYDWYILQCECFHPGACDGECIHDYCQSEIASAACAQCMATNTVDGGACRDSALYECPLNPTCVPFEQCLAACTP
jgi:hypothetical protein